MIRLVERTPTREIFTMQRSNPFVEIVGMKATEFSYVMLEHCDRGRCRSVVGDREFILPNARTPDIDRSHRHAPTFHSFSLNAPHKAHSFGRLLPNNRITFCAKLNHHTPGPGAPGAPPPPVSALNAVPGPVLVSLNVLAASTIAAMFCGCCCFAAACARA